MRVEADWVKIQENLPLSSISAEYCRLATQHIPSGCDDLVDGDRHYAVRLRNLTASGTVIQSLRRLQNARRLAIGTETKRAVAVVGIAVSGVARNDDGLAIHCRREVRGPAVIADEQVAAFEHGARLA